MKILAIHANYIEVDITKKAIKSAPEAKKGKKRYEECLVVFSAVEKQDEENVDGTVQQYIKEIKDIAAQLKVKNVVLYPYAHLSSNLSNPKAAQEVLNKAKDILSKEFEVNDAPFGWYKTFNISTKGHPLSELSREFTASQEIEISKESTTNNSTYKKLISFLDKNKAHYRLIDHPPEGRTEIVSPMRGNELSQAAHCIVVQVKIRKKEKKYILAVVPGDAKVDFDALRRLYNNSYVSFADKKTAEKLSKSVSGTILPFSFDPKLELIVDPLLLKNNEELFFNAARLDRSLALKTKDYERLANPRLESIAKYSDKESYVSNALKAEKTLKSTFFILDLDGKLQEIEYNKEKKKFSGFDFQKYPKLKKLASYEMAKDRTVGVEPPHVKLMKKHELVDYEPGSDPGNLRYYPKGRFIKSQIEKFVTKTVKDNGGMEIESPIMYDFEHPSLKSYLNRFPARQYAIQTPNKRVFLRFAACFGQFLMAHDTQISYKNLPIWLYELTRYSFRVEQRGELTGLRRLRAFTMPDCHAFCANEDQAKSEIVRRFNMSREMHQDIGLNPDDDLELAIRITKKFYDSHKEFIHNFVKNWGRPAFVEIWNEQFFYFVFKYELNYIDNLDKAVALTTDQIDVENAKRYGIEYIDENGEKKNPLVLHLSPSGAVERIIYAILENAAKDQKEGRPPSFPLWLSPTQVRLIPVSSEKHLDFCEKLAEKLTKENIRVDVDDKLEGVGKKIRSAGQEWIPYSIVIGDEESKDNSPFKVRIRGQKEDSVMELNQLIKEIKEKTKGMPYDTLPLPRNLSKRVIFVG